jgi:CRP-like cAMP-binding protein
MTDALTSRPPPENRLIAALQADARDRLMRRSERVSFGLGDPVYEPGAPVDHLYFPRTGVFSMLITMRDGSSVEVGTVGNEGMVGLPAFLGAASSPARVFCQVPGESLRLPSDALREDSVRGGPLSDLLRRYTQAVLNQVSQSAACNHLHSLGQRLARWLLMTQDRAGSGELPLTQDFLAQMLGVRRSSVSEVASGLQQAGLIRYHRGRVTVVDRTELEAASCECYRVVRDEYDRLLGPVGTT